MPEPQGVEFTQESLNEIVDFSGVGHDTNDPPEDDANPDPLPRPPHAPGADSNADPPTRPRKTPGAADTNAGPRFAAASEKNDDDYDVEDDDDDRSQVMMLVNILNTPHFLKS